MQRAVPRSTLSACRRCWGCAHSWTGAQQGGSWLLVIAWLQNHIKHCMCQRCVHEFDPCMTLRNPPRLFVCLRPLTLTLTAPTCCESLQGCQHGCGAACPAGGVAADTLQAPAGSSGCRNHAGPAAAAHIRYGEGGAGRLNRRHSVCVHVCGVPQLLALRFLGPIHTPKVSL